MNTRKFVESASVLASGIVGLSFNSANAYFSDNFNSELKDLCDSRYLTRVNLSSDLQQFLDQLRVRNIISYAKTAYQYDGNYIIEVKVEEMFWTRPGLLFVTSSGNHLLIQDKDIEVLNDFISNFKIGIEQQEINMNPAEFLFPYRINNDESAVFSYNNKYSGQIKLKMRRGRRYIFIS
jgi:hypothetical protein